MTAMSTPCRFDDKEYKNWLKCSLALIHFKESLHGYINKEVNNLHADIHRTISAIPVGTSVQTQCFSCSCRDIKQKEGNWTINCQNKICDRWLSEILANHTNPQNQNINWKNADITRWPTDAYEVAKVYMPKGQDQTKNLPQDFDACAILSLLKYCLWFSQKIPNTSILSELIEIRNEVMYSVELRVTDFKKDSCIDKMVQLLCDLNIHGDVLTELQKAKREDIDINFREIEVKVLCSVVSFIKGNMDSLGDDQHQFTDDLDTVQTTLTSIQAAQIQQRQEIQESKDNTMVTAGKVVTMETDPQGINSEVEKLTEIYQKIKSFLANNPDIDDKNILENIQAIEGRDMKGIKRKCAKIEDKGEKKHRTALEAHVSSLSSIKVKLSLMAKDESSSHNAEMRIRDDFQKGSSVFSSDLGSLVIDVEQGSVIICLRPTSKHAQETLAFFCQQGGMKDFVLNLLRKKDVFASLPKGEISIEIEVSCHKGDEVFEDAQTCKPQEDFTSGSFEVDSNPQVIKDNLRFQYGTLLEEIDPLHLQEAFLSRGILDKSFFEELADFRRRERAARFLNKVIHIGNDAMEPLVQALKDSGRENLATNLCRVEKKTSDLGDTDQVDDTLVKVIKEVSPNPDDESVLWSCRLDLLIGRHADEELPHPESSLESSENTSDKDNIKQDTTTVNTEERTVKMDRNVSGDLEEEGELSHLKSSLEVIETKSYTNVAEEDITSVKPVVKEMEKEEGELM